MPNKPKQKHGMMGVRCLTRQLCKMEAGKTEVDIAQMGEIVKCISILMYDEPMCVAWLLGLGKKHLEKPKKAKS